MLKTLHHASQWQSLQLLRLEGHIFYSVSFTYKGELAWLGEGQREEINSVYPGNCSCYCKWPRRVHYKLLCEAVSPECPSRGVSPTPSPGPQERQRHPPGVGQQSRRGGGVPGPEVRLGRFYESPGRGRRGRHRRPACPRLATPAVAAVRVSLRDSSTCRTPSTSPSTGTTRQLLCTTGAPEHCARGENGDLEPEEEGAGCANT